MSTLDNLTRAAEAGFEIHGAKHHELVRRAWHRGYRWGCAVFFVVSLIVEVLRHV